MKLILLNFISYLKIKLKKKWIQIFENITGPKVCILLVNSDVKERSTSVAGQGTAQASDKVLSK